MHLLLLLVLTLQTASPTPQASPSSHRLNRHEMDHQQSIPGPIQRSPWHHRLVGKSCFVLLAGKRHYYNCKKIR